MHIDRQMRKMKILFLLLSLVAVCRSLQTPPPLTRPVNVKVPPPVAEYLKQLSQRQETALVDTPTEDRESERNDAVETTERRFPLTGLQHRPRWELPLGYSAQHPGNLHSADIFTNIVHNRQVGERGLTAVKDDKLQACFIDHFVQTYVLPREQRRYYTHTLPGTVLLTANDHSTFQRMVGNTVYALCKRLRIYWLDSALFRQFNSFFNDSNWPTVGEDKSAQQHQAPTVGRVPAAVHSVRRPPPVSLYQALRQQGRDDSIVRPAPPRILTPPPLAEYLRQHQTDQPAKA